jgi:hypothetical protein
MWNKNKSDVLVCPICWEGGGGRGNAHLINNTVRAYHIFFLDKWSFCTVQYTVQ